MSKVLKIVLISVLVVVLLVGGTMTVLYFFGPKGKSRNDINNVPVDNTYIDGDTKKIADCTPNESLFIMAYNLKNLNNYYATVSGEVDAGIYKQTVSGEKYKSGDDSLYVSRSTSLLKNTGDQLFIEGDVVLVRHGDPKTNVFEDVTEKYTLKEYLKEYGTDYREVSNYDLKESNITESKLVSAADGIYTYRYEINVETGVDAYCVNMAKMGNLSQVPTFIKSTLEVSMTEDFMPISVTQTDEYKVVMLLELTCRSTLVQKFEIINADAVVIPELDFFRARLNEG